MSYNLLGLINARALLDEGFLVHPYMFQEDAQRIKALHSALSTSEYFKPEKLDQQRYLQRIFTDAKFAVTNDVIASSFRLRPRDAGPRHHGTAEFEYLLNNTNGDLLCKEFIKGYALTGNPVSHFCHNSVGQYPVFTWGVRVSGCMSLGLLIKFLGILQ